MLTDNQKKYLPLKRTIDVVLSGGAIVVLSPVLGLLALAIKLDSPGPVLFKQKRVGKDKELFEIYKFRTMRTDTPSDMPTHMLKDPDQFITKTGKFLRKTSLDELPQIFNIFTGKMSVIGPRPALWNQDDLIAERDKYHANDVTPGLTGWAQINGRDELEIDVKAKFDGDYVNDMSLKMDIKCFLATIGSVLLHDGVVEGGTGELKETVDTQIVDPEKIDKEAKIGAAVVGTAGAVGLTGLGLVFKHIKNKDKHKDKKSHKGLLFSLAALTYAGYTAYTNIKRKVQLQDNFINEEELKPTKKDNHLPLKKILITGANSYIGESVEKWLNNSNNEYEVDTLDMLDPNWKEYDFSKYDTVFHVAGIAHADVGNVSEEVKQKYYKVNTELTLEVANIAKEAKVKQFIFMSSMIVYSGCETTHITKDTQPKAENFYGDSKLQADLKLQEMNDESFKVVVVRPPMIYGKGSKGNYPQLAKLATKLPVFPIVDNKRSMLHIDNLCEFIKLMIDNEEAGVFFPQNDEYTNTSDMVQMIANVKGHKIIMLPGTSLPIKLLENLPGKIGSLASKAFGDSYYDMDMSLYDLIDYRVVDMKQSIIQTEETEKLIEYSYTDVSKKYSVLMSVYKNDNPDFLGMAVDSMTKQSIPPEQIVMVIDGPIPDEVNKVITKYEDDSDLFTIIRLERNRGLGNALNEGLKHCRNELIARMDSDDISLLDRCEKQLEYYIENPQTGILGTQIYEFIGKTENIVSMRKVPTTLEGIRKFAKRRSPFNHPTVMFRKSVIEQLGGYPILGRKEDLGLFVTAANKKVILANLEEALLYYRTNDENLQRRKNWINCKEYIQVMYSFHKKGYIGVSDMAYVFVGQMVMYLMPSSILKGLNKRYLRKTK